MNGRCLNADADIWTSAFKHRQPIFEWALPRNRSDYTLPQPLSVNAKVASSLVIKSESKLFDSHLFFGIVNFIQKIIRNKLSTNKSCQKYYPEVLSKNFFLSKMYLTYPTSLYSINFCNASRTYSMSLYGKFRKVSKVK